MILLFSFLVNAVDGFWFYILSFLFLEVNLQRFKNYAITSPPTLSQNLLFCRDFDFLKIIHV